MKSFLTAVTVLFSGLFFGGEVFAQAGSVWEKCMKKYPSLGAAGCSKVRGCVERHPGWGLDGCAGTVTPSGAGLLTPEKVTPKTLDDIKIEVEKKGRRGNGFRPPDTVFGFMMLITSWVLILAGLVLFFLAEDRLFKWAVPVFVAGNLIFYLGFVGDGFSDLWKEIHIFPESVGDTIVFLAMFGLFLVSQTLLGRWNWDDIALIGLSLLGLISSLAFAGAAGKFNPMSPGWWMLEVQAVTLAYIIDKNTWFDHRPPLKWAIFLAPWVILWLYS